jgi:hypothetical protein
MLRLLTGPWHEWLQVQSVSWFSNRWNLANVPAFAARYGWRKSFYNANRCCTTSERLQECGQEVQEIVQQTAAVPFLKLESRSAGQEIPPFMETRRSLLCSQEPAIGPYPEPDASNPRIRTPSIRFPWRFRPRFYKNFSSFSCVLNDPPIYSSLI